MGHSERIFHLFPIEVTLDQTMINWYHFIKPIHRIKNLLTEIHPSIHPSIPVAPTWTISDPLKSSYHFSFFVSESCRIFGRGVSPSLRPLPTHKQRKNADKHPWFEWDSNPRSKCSSGRRQFYTLDHAATVIGLLTVRWLLNVVYYFISIVFFSGVWKPLFWRMFLIW
jgi:hypothetical protein